MDEARRSICKFNAVRSFFDVLLTLRLRIILATAQLNAQIWFYNNFIIFLYMFRALLCSKHVEEYNKLIMKPQFVH